MKKIVTLFSLFLFFSYVYAQNEKVMKPKNDELKFSLKTENSTWIKDGQLIVTIEITNTSNREIEFDLDSFRFHLSPINGGFTRTFIVPQGDKPVIKIKGGETIFYTLDLSKLPFVEFESTDSGRKFGEIPSGKYRLTGILENSVESNISIEFRNCKK